MSGRKPQGPWPGEIPFGVLLAFASIGAAFEIAYGRPDLLPSLFPLGTFAVLYIIRRVFPRGSVR
jgi:hypothetical protein